jgi:hypothetical protein
MVVIDVSHYIGVQHMADILTFGYKVTYLSGAIGEEGGIPQN